MWSLAGTWWRLCLQQSAAAAPPRCSWWACPCLSPVSSAHPAGAQRWCASGWLQPGCLVCICKREVAISGCGQSPLESPRVILWLPHSLGKQELLCRWQEPPVFPATAAACGETHQQWVSDPSSSHWDSPALAQPVLLFVACPMGAGCECHLQ